MRVQVAADQRRPGALSSFFGREDELAQVRGLLATDRLITITGTGGVGKTRLALELGGEVHESFPDGVWLVELARVEDPGLVASAIADSVQAQRDAATPDLERAARALSTGRQLLVLDNCEHVIEAAAGASTELLARCPDLIVLATAREPLGIEGEHVWPIPTLDVPLSGASDVIIVGASEAVQLFADRARLVAPAFQLSTDNAADVATICRRLDGLPLALELAAAWVSVLSLKQIAARLDDTLALLGRGGSEKPPRHRTMRATLDWSHELLTPLQRATFARLSVYVGGFTLESAEEPLDVSGQESTGLEVIASLVARSLIVADTTSDEARYSLLEPVRQYAAERLRAHPDEERAARASQIRYLTRLAESAWEPILRGPDQPWLRRLGAELANIRVALAWGFAHDFEVAARLATSLSYFCVMRGYLSEGREWAQQAMRAEGRSLARAFLMAGDLAARMGDGEIADEHLAKAKQLTVDGNWPSDLILVLCAQVVAAIQRGDLASAEALCDDVLKLAEPLHDEAAIMVVHTFKGDIETARGNHQSAVGHFQEALPVARRLDHQWLTWVLLGSLASVALDMGDQTTARQAMRDVLDASTAGVFGHDDSGFAWVLENAGILAVQLDDPALGLRLMAASRAMLNRTRYGEAPDAAVRRQRWIAKARERAGAAAADTAWSRGLAMTPEHATAEAIALVMGSHQPSETKKKTFMFTDIVGSTELVEVIGDEAWHDVVDWHNRTLRDAFATCGGEEIDSAGDGFFVAFPDAQSAVECAIDVQRTLARHRHSHGFAPRVRIGLHTASATRSGGGYRGKGVHIAARVASQAGGDEILTTEATAAQLDARYERSAPRTVALKGVAGDVTVVALRWR